MLHRVIIPAPRSSCLLLKPLEAGTRSVHAGGPRAALLGTWWWPTAATQGIPPMPLLSLLRVCTALMKPMEVPDWGGAPALSYPGLLGGDHLNGTSKTVRRRHHKRALALDRLSHGVVTLRSRAAPAPPGIVASEPGMSCVDALTLMVPKRM